VNTTAMLLVGDVGATKTDLAIVSPEEGARAPLAESTFLSASYDGLEAIVVEFLGKAALRVDAASIGLAAPVVGGRGTFTNLPWSVTAKRLRKTFALSAVWLLNDLVAIAHGIPHLRDEELHTLNEGEPQVGGTIGVIAPGTGLGEAFLTWDEGRYRAHASEGSHADFAPTDSFQMGLLRTMWNRFDHVSVERICSGLGLPNIYAALRAEGIAAESAWVADRLAATDDPTPVIVNAALDPKRACALCRRTLDIFVRILGTEAGNLALKLFATGGVYLAGGIPPRILPVLQEGSFLEAFQNKGRYAQLLAQMPVHVVLYSKVALLGAAQYGLEAEAK